MIRTIIKSIEGALALIGAWVVDILGGVNDIIIVLLALVVIDYLTGVIKACIKKVLSSEIGFRGLARKAMILTVVALGHLVDVYLIKEGNTIRCACIFFYIANETLSVIENMGEIGVPLPEKLKSILLQLKDKEDNNNGSTD